MDDTAIPPKEVLYNAKMATFMRIPDSSQAWNFARELANETGRAEMEYKPRQRRRSTTQREVFLKGVGALGGELVRHSGNLDAKGFCYRAADRAAFTGTGISSRNFEHLTELWEKIGLIEMVRGYGVRDDPDSDLGGGVRGYAARLRATQKLMAIAGRHDLTPENVWQHFKETFDDSLPVVVRAKKGKHARTTTGAGRTLKLESSERLEGIADTIRRINVALRATRWNLEATPFLVRIFSNGDDPNYSYNKGGRLYCRTEDNYQQRKQAERLKITMNGEPCAEVDVRASQLAIYSARYGVSLHPDEDPYEIEGVERDVVKGLVTASFGNGGLPTRWPRGLREDYLARHGRKIGDAYKLKDVKDRLLARHPVLSKLKLGKNDALVLQYEESEAIIAAMLRLIDLYDVVALPVHDSLVTAGSDIISAEDVLHWAYRERFGIEIRTRIEWGSVQPPRLYRGWEDFGS